MRPRSSRWFQISATLPSAKRKMFAAEKRIVRPVGSMPAHGPVWVPVAVHRPTTKSPSPTTSSISKVRSGNAVRKSRAIFF